MATFLLVYWLCTSLYSLVVIMRGVSKDRGGVSNREGYIILFYSVFLSWFTIPWAFIKFITEEHEGKS